MDKILVRQLKNLKKIKPSASLLLRQRSFLLSEIGKIEQKNKKHSLILPLFNFNILKIFKPAFAVALAIIILFSSLGTIGAISLAQNSLPGDFLYPVKTAFEKTQMTFTASEEKKVKLSIKFANHRMDEFTQLANKPEEKEDTKKSIQDIQTHLVSIQDKINKLKETNAGKAAEVAKLVKAQVEVYEETLIGQSEQLAYIMPGDEEEIRKDIDQALEEVDRTMRLSEGLIPEQERIEEEIIIDEAEEILVPAEDVEQGVESESFDNIE